MDTIVKNRPTESEKLFADLDKPSLHALSYSLRHPDTWPKGFIWNYNNCSSCAMGLAHYLWSGSIPDTNINTGASIMAREFAMPFKEAKSIFLGSAAWTPTQRTGHLWWAKDKYNLDIVTPEMVADQIDKYLATAE